MNSSRPRILSQIGDAQALQLPADLRDQVVVVPVSPTAPPPPGLTGDVLLLTFRHTNGYELAERGVTWVHFLGSGIDRLDVQRLVRGRILTTSRGAQAIPIAEWVLAALLHHEKRLAELFIRQPPARWPVRPALGTLYGKQLALLGLGAIGIAIAERLLPFGAQVRALRHTVAPSPLPAVELVRSFNALVAGADHLILAAPLTPSTKHIVNTQTLAHAKPGLHLVNIARGDLVDQDALRLALDRGDIAAATLDAVTPEPLPAGHWLYQHPRVRLSPHIAWSWPHVQETATRIFADNLRRYLAGQPLLNTVDPSRGY